MDTIARYDAAEILFFQGFNAAIDFIRGYVKGCRLTAERIAEEIAANGE